MNSTSQDGQYCLTKQAATAAVSNNRHTATGHHLLGCVLQAQTQLACLVGLVTKSPAWPISRSGERLDSIAQCSFNRLTALPLSCAQFCANSQLCSAHACKTFGAYCASFGAQFAERDLQVSTLSQAELIACEHVWYAKLGRTAQLSVGRVRRFSYRPKPSFNVRQLVQSYSSHPEGEACAIHRTSGLAVR